MTRKDRNKPMWRQLNLRFENRDTAEHTAATHLAPVLTEIEAAELLSSWFYVRKTITSDAGEDRHCWRLRVLPRDEQATPEMLAFLRRMELSAPWTETIYEPEVHAFGGPAAMDLAHDLFHQDSHHILSYLRTTSTARTDHGRDELAMLLCSQLLRGAEQDWYEQGDIWARVAHHRRPPHELPPEHVRRLQSALRQTMIIDSRRLAETPTNPLSFAAEWLSAFAHAGTQLGKLAATGDLQRGLRAVLAQHVLFAWNRIGLTPAKQTLLAHTAKTVVFG